MRSTGYNARSVYNCSSWGLGKKEWKRSGIGSIQVGHQGIRKNNRWEVKRRSGQGKGVNQKRHPLYGNDGMPVKKRTRIWGGGGGEKKRKTTNRYGCPDEEVRDCCRVIGNLKGNPSGGRKVKKGERKTR